MRPALLARVAALAVLGAAGCAAPAAVPAAPPEVPVSEPAATPSPAPSADPARERIRAVAAARRRFDDDVLPVRADLYRYCRSLTGNVWDAEDLLQETLLRGFGVLAEMHGGVRDLRPYLFRTATNVWIDQERRRAPGTVSDDDVPEPSTEPVPLGPEVREALADLAHRLPPRERVAVLLADVFGFSGAEVAASMRTTDGAAKAALHRGRARLADGPRKGSPSVRAGRAPSERLVDEFASAFTARDVARLVALMLPGGTTEVIGIVRDLPESPEGGTFAHTVAEDGFVGARRATFHGEPVLLLSYRVEEGGGALEVVRDVVRIEEAADRCARLRYYYFCPEALEEVCGALGVPFRTNGIHY